MLKVLLIAGSIVLAGIVALPVVVAGTLDPCEAVARIVVRKTAKPKIDEPWNILADEVATKIGAAYARSHGTLACYRLIPKVLDKNFKP